MVDKCCYCGTNHVDVPKLVQLATACTKKYSTTINNTKFNIEINKNIKNEISVIINDIVSKRVYNMNFNDGIIESFEDGLKFDGFMRFLNHSFEGCDPLIKSSYYKEQVKERNNTNNKLIGGIKLGNVDTFEKPKSSGKISDDLVLHLQLTSPYGQKLCYIFNLVYAPQTLEEIDATLELETEKLREKLTRLTTLSDTKTTLYGIYMTKIENIMEMTRNGLWNKKQSAAGLEKIENIKMDITIFFPISTKERKALDKYIEELNDLVEDLEQKSDELDKKERTTDCVVCLTQKKNCVFSPCGHIETCMSCGAKLTKCPVCRKNISSRIKTFLS